MFRGENGGAESSIDVLVRITLEKEALRRYEEGKVLDAGREATSDDGVKCRVH
jgi:hypothetical protein